MQTTFSPYRVLLSGALLLTALLSTFVLLGLMTHPAQAAMPTYVGGPITTNTTWTTANSPYILTETVAIMAGVTLTVEPGVTVMGQPGFYFFVEGHLQAVGTATTPITFTSQQDSAPNQWTGISFVGGSSHLQHVTVRYGEFNIGIGVIDPDAQIVIEDSTISQSAGYGIDIALGSLHQLVLSNTTFAANYQNRISIYDWPTNNLVTNTVLSPQPGLEGYEFMVQNYINVPDGLTLTVESGVTLLLPDEAGILRVYGYLEAVGTPNNPITFTSSTDTPLWSWVLVFEGGSGHLRRVYLYDGVVALWRHSNLDSQVIIEDSTIQESDWAAMDIASHSLHSLVLSNTSFVNNYKNRIMIHNEITPTMIADVTLTAQPGLESYEIYDDAYAEDGLIVPTGLTLTLQPGVTLMQAEQVLPLRVEGTLQALGMAVSPITFTSATNSAAGEWAGIVVSGTADFAHTTVRYAQTGVTVAGGAVSAVCSTFTDNLLDGVYVDSTGSPTVNLSASAIFGNGGWNLFNNNSTQVEARYNWWGSPSDPASTISGNVLYTPWLTEPTCPAPPPVYHLYLPLVLTP